MIYAVENSLMIPKINEFIGKNVTASFASPSCKMFVDEKDGIIRGFIQATIELKEGNRAIFINELRGERGSSCELLSRVEKWGRSMEAEGLYYLTNSPRDFGSKFKFSYHGTLLRRPLHVMV
jgi:hypothetical protein